MTITGWQFLAFLFYAASAIAVYAVTMVYQVIRSDLAEKPTNRHAAMVSTLSALFWPVILPLSGIAAAFLIITHTKTLRPRSLK